MKWGGAFPAPLEGYVMLDFLLNFLLNLAVGVVFVLLAASSGLVWRFLRMGWYLRGFPNI